MVPLMAPIVITISNDCLCVPLSYLIHWYVVIQWSVTNYIWTVMYHHGLWLKRKKKKVWPAHQADCNGSEFHSRSCILDRLTGPNGASGRGCVCFHRRRRSKRVPDVLSMPIPDNSPWLVVPWRMTPFSMHATGRTSLSLFIFTYLFIFNFYPVAVILHTAKWHGVVQQDEAVGLLPLVGHHLPSVLSPYLPTKEKEITFMLAS